VSDETPRRDRHANDATPAGMDRRTALKLIAAAATMPAIASGCGPGEPDPAAPLSRTRDRLAAGTATDPDLLAPVVPWERTLSDEELSTLAALCDVILPADDRSPSASSVGAHDFIDEWVSAPYEAMRRDAVLIRGGVVWLNAESERRFGPPFRDLTGAQRTEICDDICYAPEAPPELRAATRFFDRVRDLAATAFYTTPEGMKDLGYVGNTPQARWGPPPEEVLRRVGLA
jgi:hypothetical protein